ncbi:hypothetical protein [Polaribacter sargassicola]|uniref:hypothetical protein n=1 Tax=Polaribacter sargassicola TaxID=2836891 RepID=UPI001F460EBA|nr:hypothetical protein [Polaribacter sp. DS7-9]
MILKLSIVIGCTYFIYLRLGKNEQLFFSDFYQKLSKNNIFSFKTAFILFIFSFLNWFLEILKWKYLVGFLKKISFYKAAKQSLASLTTSLITPNRIGEYGAKAIYFNKNDRKKILGLNFVGNFYQMLMTLFFGVIGFSYFSFLHKVEINFPQIFIIFLTIFIAITAFFLIIKRFNLGELYFKKVRNFTKKIPLSLNIKVSFLSFLRFVVFSHQFYFLLIIFTVNISYLEAISAITSVYLIASIIPMLSLFDVVLKSSVAIWVFSFFNAEPLTILSITTLMWILNFVLPAIIGCYFVLTFKPNFVK